MKEIGGLETNRINQLVVEPTLQTTRDPDIYAIGDCAPARVRKAVLSAARSGRTRWRPAR
jgi:NADH dehydrogenase FAD-containing subunit